jgi:hypothetical protein
MHVLFPGTAGEIDIEEPLDQGDFNPQGSSSPSHEYLNDGDGCSSGPQVSDLHCSDILTENDECNKYRNLFRLSFFFIFQYSTK